MVSWGSKFHYEFLHSAETVSGNTYGTPAVQNFDELVLQLQKIEQREPIALSWEQDHRRRSELSVAGAKRLQEVEQWYLREIGVHPADREKLRDKIMKATLDGCRQSLQEVLNSVVKH